ncbi:exonuclease SbcCD subunit D [Melissococcus plutonius]|uniref:Nuclease SbcCD subunit D n=1 Tax=Melissococcus plutonius (strain ATCC 35311 / DSM 29964 / CIP 104052 / LMG 20360 / NCIMB 702443) TaxID=940190 RepID=F3Y9Z3_MELPT|nr:exonuclease SbcCD subunit D [Melissococcus plutonius]KMT32141.1 nuclease SbcCD subunit D [Melissococcus plutonius]KMT34712.1 nuclease SbcCD subunit D [Melissococcus plutonius]KMT40643.1 nuclease SbcCD subunit D [Melissococcus plutonius]MBB5176912.1 exonuclease SbcD [Melissococcus plutonius]BAK21321.1 exonuclease SbcD [Melissococcus plutonius ATCC 35311]
MRFLHTADWHIGKKLHGYNLLEEQATIFQQIISIAKEEKVEAIIIAGDLYDRAVPSTEAIQLFNNMMVQLNLEQKFSVLAISGNHDNSVRLETGSPWFTKTNYYLYTQMEQVFTPINLGNTQFFLLPYFEPIAARIYFEDDQIKTMAQAIERIIKKIVQQFDSTKNHVLVSHFFVAGSEKTESETKLTVGGLDAVPVDLLAPFDYTALGHLHGKDALKHPTVYYSGSPLKFSLSEMNQQKGVWIVDSENKPFMPYFRELTMIREIKKIQGDFQTLVDPKFYQTIHKDDYIYLQLTEQAIIPSMMAQLRKIYTHMIKIECLTRKKEVKANEEMLASIKQNDPQKLITCFFNDVIETSLTGLQQDWVKKSLTVIQQKEREI